jgi:ribosomal protein S21
MVNAEVIKTGNESPLSVIRKFSRRVQGTGLIQTSRKRRYFERPASKAVSKKRALKRIKRHQEFRRLVKEGKVSDAPRRGRGRPMSAAQASAPREQSAPARFGESTPIAR